MAAGLVRSILTDVARRKSKKKGHAALASGRKSVLVVLFIPSVARDGVTPVDQQRWVDAALALFGSSFGGATAFPRAKGVWRDDDRGGALIFDEPVMIHCYTGPGQIQDEALLADLATFCRRMGRETRQGEIGLVIGDEYIGIREFSEEQP